MGGKLTHYTVHGFAQIHRESISIESLRCEPSLFPTHDYVMDGAPVFYFAAVGAYALARLLRAPRQ